MINAILSIIIIAAVCLAIRTLHKSGNKCCNCAHRGTCAKSSV